MTQDPLDGAVAAIMGSPPKKSSQDQWLDDATARIMALPEPTLGQKALSAVQGVGAGLAGGTRSILTDFPHAIGLGIANTAADVLGRERVDESSFQRDPATMIGRGLDIAQAGATPANPLLSGGAPFHYGEVVGQVAPALAAATLGPAGAMIGATQVAGQTGIDAARGGASGLGTLAATAGGYVAGGALSGGVAATLENISVRGGGALGRILSQVVPGAGVGVTLPVMTNAIHNWATDDEIPLLQGTGEGAIIGGALGGLVAMATEAALAKRARTGRRQTSQGWTGELLPEEHPITDAPDSIERQQYIDALIQGSQATTEQWLTDPRFAPQRQEVAQAEGARYAAQHAQMYAEMPQGPEVVQTGRRETQKPAPTTGEPIYDPVTGAYKGNRELPREIEPGVTTSPEGYTTQGTRGVKRPTSVAQGEPNTAGITVQPDESSMESTLVAPPKGTLNIRGGQPKPAPVVDEHGFYPQRDESLLYAPLSRPDYSRLANPVTDPLTGRTIVTDIGTPTNPSTGLRVTVEDTYKARGTMLRTDVVSAITTAAQKLGSFAVRTGLVPEGSSGLYDPVTREARIAKYGDLKAAAHEAGHAVETAMFGHDYSPDRSPQWKAIEPELAKMGRELYPDTTPHNGHVSEGIAEFLSTWVLQHEDLMHVAPETTKWFDSVFLEAHPEFKSSLKAAREAGDQYRFQGSAKRTQPIDPTAWSIRFRRSNLGQLWHGIKRNWIESGQAIYDLQRAAADAGHLFERGKRAVDVFVAKRATADSILSKFVHDETFDVGRQRTGDSLRSVTDQVRGQGKDFYRYLGLRSGQWRNETKTKIDPDTGERVLAAEPIPFMSVDVAHEMATLEAKYPHFRGTSDAVLAWFDRVLGYVGGHDPALAQAAKMMREDGEFYMPLHRWADWYETQNKATGSKRAAATAKLGERSSGSTREILDPLPGLIAEARKMIERGHERAVQNAVIQNAVDAGLVQFVSDVTSKIKPKLMADLPFKAGESYGMPFSDLAALQVFNTDTAHNPDGSIVPYKRAITMPDGTPGFEVRYYQFDPKLHEAVMSMDPTSVMQAMGFMGTTLRFFKNTFVLGAVGLNASFLMLKNPIRDAQSLYVNSRNNPHLVSLIPQLAWEHSRTFMDQITAGHVGYDWVKTYDQLGLDKSDRYATFASSSATAKNLTRAGISRVVNLDTPASFIRALGHVMQASEKATRIWELKQTAKKVGWTPGDYMSPEQAVAMAVDARQVTVDFTAGGRIAQQVNQAVPFFNVAIQGKRSWGRALKENTGSAVLRNSAMMGLGAALWYAYKDEDWMQALPAYERAQAWFIPLGKTADGENILARIPLGQESAVPVKAAEFFLDGWHSKDPYSAGQYMQALWEVVGVNGTNPLLDEAMRQAFNRKGLFNSSEIVPEALQHKNPQDQVAPNTGPLAVWLGQTFKVSPVRADSAIHNTLGGLGGSVDTVLSWVQKRSKRPTEAADSTLIGALARRGGPVSLQSRNVSDLYELAETANRNAPAKPDAASVRTKLLLDNTTKMVSLATTILNVGTLSTSERQALTSVVNQYAKDAVDQVRGGGIVDPSKAIRQRVKLEVQANSAKNLVKQATMSVGTGQSQ